MTDITNYQEHIVAFVDLLGFKDAIKSKDSKEILDLLQSFIRLRNDSPNIRVVESVGCHILPAISVFSDNIVISVPIDKVPDIFKAELFSIIARYVEDIAAASLEKGFLIRGGITQGMLYHQDGVVFGNGLIEAYELESSIANYPRVLISKTLLNNPNFTIQKNTMRYTVDYDGLDMLYYASGMFRAGISEGNGFNDEIKNRIDSYENIISANIKKFKDSPKILSKWIWFSKYFEDAKRRFRPDLQIQ